MRTISTLEFEIYHNLASLSSHGNQILIWAQKKKSVQQAPELESSPEILDCFARAAELL